MFYNHSRQRATVLHLVIVVSHLYRPPPALLRRCCTPQTLIPPGNPPHRHRLSHLPHFFHCRLGLEKASVLWGVWVRCTLEWLSHRLHRHQWGGHIWYLLEHKNTKLSCLYLNLCFKDIQIIRITQSAYSIYTFVCTAGKAWDPNEIYIYILY